MVSIICACQGYTSTLLLSIVLNQYRNLYRYWYAVSVSIWVFRPVSVSVPNDLGLGWAVPSSTLASLDFCWVTCHLLGYLYLVSFSILKTHTQLELDLSWVWYEIDFYFWFYSWFWYQMPTCEVEGHLMKSHIGSPTAIFLLLLVL